MAKAKDEFKNKLIGILGISENHIRSIELKNSAEDTQLIQTIVVQLTGENRLKSEDLAKIKGLTIITPNTLEINAGEFDL